MTWSTITALMNSVGLKEAFAMLVQISKLAMGTSSPQLVVFMIVVLLYVSSGNGQDVVITSTEPFSSGMEIRVSFSYPVEEEENVTSYIAFADYLGPCTDEPIPERVFEVTLERSARTLLLTGLQEASLYRLTVTAIMESEEILFSVPVLESTPSTSPSSPATNLTATRVGITSVSIQWDPVPCLDRNIAELLDYYVGVAKENSSLLETVFLSSSNSTFTLQNLEPNTSYYIRVHTVPSSSSFVTPGNDHGPISQQLHIQTLPDLEVFVGTIPSTFTGILRVDWTFPPELEEEVVSFLVVVDYIGMCNVPIGFNSQNETVDSSRRSLTFAGVLFNSLYKATVTTNDTTSSATAIASTLPGDIDVPPGNVTVVDVTTSSISVTFDPIPCQAQNANITDYAIDFGRGGNPPSVVGRIVENFSFTLTGLDRNTSYFFDIYPIIEPALGLSVARASRTVQTLSDISIIPVEINTTSITVRWVPPEVALNPAILPQNQTISITYTGPCEREVVDLDRQEFVIGPEERSMMFENLEESGDYEVTVIAEYPSDTVSGVMIIRTAATVPDSALSSVSILHTTDTSIRLSWEPVACLDKNSRIAGYIVEYGPTTSYPETQSPVLQDLAFTIQNREPSTSYSFQVYPVLEYGQGLDDLPVPRTAKISVRTQVSSEASFRATAGSCGSAFATAVVLAVVLVLLVLAAILIAVVVIVRKKVTKSSNKNYQKPVNLNDTEFENCAAYSSLNNPSPPVSPEYQLKPLSNQPMALPLPKAPPLLPRTLSSTNHYETIPYANYDRLPVTDTYSTLAHTGFEGGTEQRYSQRRKKKTGSGSGRKSGGLEEEESRMIVNEEGFEEEEEEEGERQGEEEGEEASSEREVQCSVEESERRRTRTTDN